MANPFRTLRSVVRFDKIELDPVARRLQGVANIDDLRRIAKRRLPGGVFDYIDGGAEDEVTMGRNSSAFNSIEFNPRVLQDVSNLDTSTTLLGRKIAMPLVVAPTGFVRIAHPAGELAESAATARAGVPYTLSTMSTRSIEEVAVSCPGPKWFQVYVWPDRDLVKEMLDRATAAAYEAIVITVDTAVLGRRERDVRRGMELPPKLRPGMILEGLLKPAWTLAFLRAEPILFANVVGKGVGDGSNAISLGEYAAKQFDPKLSWHDIDWFREHWSGPIVLKGIQTVEDAKRAADAGVEAIALSNHGGRQLDGAPPPVELIDPVARAVGDDVEIICDGGVRRGSDIVKAVALGARACMVGRPFLYGLGAAGERGVDFVFDFFREGLERTMALNGTVSIDRIGRDLVSIRR